MLTVHPDYHNSTKNGVSLMNPVYQALYGISRDRLYTPILPFFEFNRKMGLILCIQSSKCYMASTNIACTPRFFLSLNLTEKWNSLSGSNLASITGKHFKKGRKRLWRKTSSFEIIC